MSVQNRHSFAEVGSGTLDMPGILKTAEAIGAQWSIVEQDHSQRGPLESAAISFKNLKALGMG
jgi:sugar phosphate isomerase/epimerase